MTKIRETRKIGIRNNPLSNPSGQGIMEYIILSSFIGIVCLLAVKQFGSVLEKRIDYLKSQIVENIKMQ